jgi:hypothetical protein
LLSLPVALSADFYSLSATDIDGKKVDFASFRGKVVLVVNVASECGYTQSHYTGLTKLYRRFADTKLFTILAFPCNQFGGQEPHDDQHIKVLFPHFALCHRALVFLLFSYFRNSSRKNTRSTFLCSVRLTC